MKINDTVKWLDCPDCLKHFDYTRIRGLSPCGKYALLSCIAHPVPVTMLEPWEGPFLLYAPITENHWQSNGKDWATGCVLADWVKSFESRTRKNNA